MPSKKPRPTSPLIGGLKFEIGQAVLILWRPHALSAYLAPIPGVITHLGLTFVTVATEEGTRRARPHDLAHRGCCLACEAAAIVGDAGALVCPRCEGPADAPLPDRLLPEWEGSMENDELRRLRIMLATGCRWRAAAEELRAQQRAAEDAMLARMGRDRDRFWREVPWEIRHAHRDILQRAADKGDETTFRRIYQTMLEQVADAMIGAMTRGMSRDDAESLVLGLIALIDRHEDKPAAGPAAAPPLQIVRPADDSTPDGADDLTRWLDGQFKKAA